MQLRRFLCVITAVALTVPLAAQTSLPNDPAVRSGSLASGLRYYVVTSGVQPDRVLVQLSVKAGSVDEADDQRGVAHLRKPMAFNGSTHFKPGEMFSYFQSMGSVVGAHINAGTSFDSTRYFLDVPVTQSAAVHRAFEAMRDVADGLTLDAAQLERERRIVIEEWRRQLGVAQRQQQPLDAAWFGGSRYADRPVLGDVDRLAVMSIDRVRRFYRDHYRPDRMALIVTGGMPVATLESLVHETFDSLAANPSKPRSLPDSLRHTGTRYAAFADPEVRNPTVGVMFLRPRSPVRTVEELRGELVHVLAGVLMSERLASLARQPDAPFRAATARPLTPIMNTDVVTFSAVVADGKPAAALTALLREIARAREHGFTDAELFRVRTAGMAAVLTPPRSNRAIVDGLTVHFLRDEPFPAPTQLAAAAQTFLPRVTNDEIRAAIRTTWSDTNRVVTSALPAGPSTSPVTERVLRQTVAAADSAALPPPWQPPAAVTVAATALPPPGKVVSRRDEKESGITVLTLSNGMEVWLKPLRPGATAPPAPIGAPSISFAVLARGGASLAPPAERSEALLAGQLVAGGGVGGMTPAQRAQALQGRPIVVQPFVTANAHGMNASARPPDIDAVLNLVHLHFTAPNDDPAAFERVKSSLLARLQTQATDPAAALELRAREINTSGFAPMRAQTAEEVTRADASSSLQFYKEQFSNAADFTLFAAGPFSVETMTPLIEKYVGSLPSTGKARAVAGVGAPSFPSSVVRETIRKGREPRAQVTLTYFAPGSGDAAREERATAIASIVRTRIYNRLRGVMGATYTVNASWANVSPEFGTITIGFVCAPAAAPALADAAIEEARRLAHDGPTAEEVAAARDARLQELKARLNQAGYWINAMEAARRQDRSAASVAFDPEAVVGSLVPDELKASAREYLPESRYTVVTLLPEGQ